MHQGNLATPEVIFFQNSLARFHSNFLLICVYRYLMWSLNSTSGVRLQDSSNVFGGVARSEIGYHLAKDFLIEHVDDIYN